jgi:lipopolysaccharide/colanic/teichoic acid biosynthesis glycosyltransferase
LITAPLIAVIAVVIKLDDGGSILYSQERTATFGDTFRVFKFRSMAENVGGVEPIDDADNPYITRIGWFLRRTHLDEIPQLYSILKGDMSVVGPRAVWVDEEFELEAVADDWRKRWFVKPGLTGLAQINGVTSTEPEAKLRYDIEYIRRQSFWFDLQIVTRQLWQVLEDFVAAVRRR